MTAARATANLALWTTLAVTLLSSACAPVSARVRPSHPLLRSESGAVAPPMVEDFAPLIDDPPPQDAPRGEVSAARQKIAATAATVLGESRVVVGERAFRADCSGTVRGIYHKAGYTLGTAAVPGAKNDTRVLYEVVRLSGSLRREDPLPGDLVFFDDTWDQNRDGRIADPLSHVGVVEGVESDGTVVFIHRIGRSIVRQRLNLARPTEREDEHGNVLNHVLRAAQLGRPAALTGELFVAFGSLPLDEMAPDADPKVAAR